MRRKLLRVIAATALLGLSGCYAYPAYPYGPEYGAPVVAGPVVAVPAPSVYVGGGWGGYGRGCCWGGGYGRGWR